MALSVYNFCVLLGAMSLSFHFVLAQNYPLVPDTRCNCYRTNTSVSHYFRNHKFFDFRSLSQYARVPAPIDTAQGNTDAPVTSAYFQSPDASMGGNPDTTGSDVTVLMVNSPNNIYIQHNDDRNPTSTIAMFTFHNADTLSKVQESDLEIRTNDPVEYIQYTNQPSWNEDGSISQATRNVSLSAKLGWSDWQYHRMDWTPGPTSWLVDGELVSSIQFQAPKDAGQVVFNTWSDGGTWSGKMTANSAAELQIQWVEFVYNTTDGNAGTPAPPVQPPPWGWNPGIPSNPQTCGNICSIDHTSKMGTPVLVQEPQSGGGGGSGPGTCTAAKYAQCAGKNWSGCGRCVSSTTCKYQSVYYSQCL
ncbi:carbohydrate-binding module family 1 protein [Nemania serpens]|nr:carbohydrate-binding module family 1 protein [Nemania serpens]